MEELTDDQKAEILDKIKKASEERQKIPESERKYAIRPERFNYLIGVDPEGNPYPVRPKEKHSNINQDDD